MRLGAFKGVRWSHFLDTTDEWHSLIHGWCSVLWPFPPRFQPSEELRKEIEDEHHYYVAGQVLGLFTWGLNAKLIQVVFF